MKPRIAFIALILITLTAACGLDTPGGFIPTPAPMIEADTFFYGHAYLDSNNNREIDPDDEPVQGALFTAAGFRNETDISGNAMIVIPDGLDYPVTASMVPPEGTNYSLISPTEVTLQYGIQDSADFLFASSTAIPNSQPTEEPTPNAVEIDKTYCITSSGVELTMDVYYPLDLHAPAPVVVYVHFYAESMKGSQIIIFWEIFLAILIRSICLG